MGEGAFPTQRFDNLCPEHFKLTRRLCVVGPDAAEQRPSLVHLFLIADTYDLAFGYSLHPFKDLAHQLINDAVKGMGGVAGLSVTLCLLAGFTIADISDSLYNAVGIVLAGISLAVGGQREPGAAMPTKQISGQQRLAPGVKRNTPLLFGRVGPGCTHVLCSLEQLQRNDLQVRQHLGAIFAAAEYASIGEVANDPPDAGVVPHLT